MDVVFVQETHSDCVNEGDWKREWPGEVFLSHKRSNSAGVGILFYRAFALCSVEVLDIMSGHILRVNALDEKLFLFVFMLSFKYCEDELFECSM